MTVPGGPWGAPPYRREPGAGDGRQEVARRGRHAAPDDEGAGAGRRDEPGAGRRTGPDRTGAFRPADTGGWSHPGARDGGASGARDGAAGWGGVGRTESFAPGAPGGGRRARPDGESGGAGWHGVGAERSGTGRWHGPDPEPAGTGGTNTGAWDQRGANGTSPGWPGAPGTGADSGPPRPEGPGAWAGMDQTGMFAPDGILGDRSSATGGWPSAPRAPERDPAPESRPPPALPHPGRATVRRRRRRRKVLEWPVLVVVSLVSAFLIRTFVIQSYYIPSGSMRDTLVEGDHVVVNKLSYHLHGVGRGDVVVFRRPPNLRIEDDDLIKRVIGLPGETVEAHDGKVYVDGRALTEPYVRSECGGTEDFLAVSVPADDLFVMGDNRCDSKDSRSFGPISTDLVVGRAFLRYWPLGRFGLL